MRELAMMKTPSLLIHQETIETQRIKMILVMIRAISPRSMIIKEVKKSKNILRRILI